MGSDGVEISAAASIPFSEISDLIHRTWTWALGTERGRQVNSHVAERGDASDSDLTQLSAIQVKYYKSKEFWHANQIQAIREKHHASLIEIKIKPAETSTLKNSLKTKKWPDELKDVGVTACADDFGTKFPSLSITSVPPIKYIKIDESLARGASTNTALTKRTIFTANASRARPIRSTQNAD